MSNTRTFTILLAFAAGVAAGVALAWLLEDRPVAPGSTLQGDEEPAAPRGEEPPELLTKGRPPEPTKQGGLAAPQPTVPPLAPFEPPADADLPPGVAGWIRVEVVPPADQDDAGGEVYVLDAGAPGVDEIERIPHGDAYASDPAVIPIARPGRYDVGLVYGAINLIRTDVRVEVGETTTVVFRFPAPQGITVTLVDPLPELPGWLSRVNLQLEPIGSERRVPYPGRGERRNYAWGWTQTQRTMTVGNVPPGGRYRIRAQLTRYQAKPKPRWKPLSGHAGICTPEEVGPGSHVRLHIVPSGKLHLRATLDLATWSAGLERNVRLELRHAGGTIVRQAWVEQGGDSVFSWSFVLPSGPVTISWTGRDVRSGKLTGIDVRSGETTRVEAQFAYTGRVTASGRPLRIEVDWPRGLDGDEPLRLAGAWSRFEGPPEVSSWSIEKGDNPEQEPRVRTATGLIGAIGRTWATGPLEVPRGDLLRVRPVRGGLLVITPEVSRPESMGSLVLRRPDGLPIHQTGEGWEHEVPAVTGRVIGPFVPGEHTFQVWLGSRRLPDVKATVRAGRTAALVIPE